ncbi:hypothetical protein SD71_21325 [Cohnella kolymensis]|uniref:PepSY domain-containing protein n=1 Tax=Cohnella kolymensis TaxID=1590652 RepID=A0ABR4ZZF8_9BACL|nr:PepSY domain-containing protein [Cohnella kolymensis]KIL34202.1 hypothetical protein SD71_21325 [Cohnella kolymensis]
MNRKIGIAALSAAIMVGGIAGTGAALANNYEVSKTSIVATDYRQKLTIKRAKELALSNVAGTVQNVQLYMEQGVTYYKVTITVKVTWSYNVLIDAYSGNRLFVTTDSSGYRYFYHVSSGKWMLVGKKAFVKAKLSSKQAAAIAVAKVGGKVVKIERDDYQDKLAYVIELKTKQGEVKVYVLASTGKVLSVVWDRDYDDDRHKNEYRFNDNDHHKNSGRGHDDDHNDGHKGRH